MNFSIYEMTMLVCFGASWPFAIMKTFHAKNPAGKSYLFLFLVIIGYIAGCTHKIVYKFDFIFWLYLLNGLMVTSDVALCLYYRHKIKQKERELIKAVATS